MKKVIYSSLLLFLAIVFASCAASGYSVGDYQNAHIAKDGFYKFSHPKLDSSLIVKVSTHQDEKTHMPKKMFSMLTMKNDSNNFKFSDADENVIIWPFYSISKENQVSTRISEKGNFEDLVKRHPYFISAGSYNGEVGFSYRLDFSQAQFLE